MATESKPIELGVPCPEFDLIGVDDQKHSLRSYDQHSVLVVAFTCNHCPYVQAYESRLNELAKAYKSKSVAFVCINSNDEKTYPEDSFEKMKERAKAKSFHFDYLRDSTQEVARAFQAACTPEFYVYDQERKLRYHGRLDDNHQDVQAVKHTYLKDVLDDLLANKEPRWKQTNAIGCSIKWKA